MTAEYYCDPPGRKGTFTRSDMSKPEEIKADIEKLLKDISSLPAIPAIVQKVLTMAQNPDADFQALAQEISKDPGLTAGILKLSNSAYYHPAREIRSVHEAIVTLGLQTVKDIVLITATKGVLKQPIDGYKMEASELWDHSLVTAGLAAKIAEMKKTKTPQDVAFTAGLLHDVGKVILAAFFKKIYRQIAMEMQQNPQARFTELEKKYMGYNHSEIGAYLLKTWNFPAELVEAAVYNYHPEKAKVNPELVSIIHIANMVALSGGVGVDAGGMSEALSKTALDNVGLKDEEIKSLYEYLPELLESLTDMRAM